jgi:hypothetical protein
LGSSSYPISCGICSCSSTEGETEVVVADIALMILVSEHNNQFTYYYEL